MRDSILGQYTRPRSDDAGIVAAADDDASDDLGAFGFLRGTRERATMLELRRRDGSIRAVSYAWLERAEFDPSDGIALRINGQTILIKGRNLNVECRPAVRLFSAICRHRVPWVQEADGPAQIETGERATIVESIEW